ncbi:MAG: DUF371 domain-containing protein [Thermoprotei archaeon]
MIAWERVIARGHENVKATHPTTLEITKDKNLTPRGDCIIGVEANKAASDFSNEFKTLLRSQDAILIVILRAGEHIDYILAHGSDKLLLSNSEKIIIRRSTYIEPATVGIRSSKAARDIKRELIDVLKDPNTRLVADFYVIRVNYLEKLVANLVKHHT